MFTVEQKPNRHRQRAEARSGTAKTFDEFRSRGDKFYHRADALKTEENV